MCLIQTNYTFFRIAQVLALFYGLTLTDNSCLLGLFTGSIRSYVLYPIQSILCLILISLSIQTKDVEVILRL